MPLNRSSCSNLLLHQLMLASILFACCLFTGCQTKTEQAPKAAPKNAIMRLTLTPAQEKNLGIQIDTVRLVTLTDRVICNGQVQAAEPLRVQAFSPVPGRVTHLPVSLGQTIRQGQLIAHVKSDEVGQLESELLQQLLENEAELRQANAQLELSRATYQREQKLLQEEVTSKADFEAARAQFRKDEAVIASLRIKIAASTQAFRERLSLLGVSSEAIGQLLQTRRISPYLSITAPRSGMVTERNVNPGEWVDSSKTLLTISDLSEVWLMGDVYEKDLAKVRAGQPISVKIDSLPDQTFNGTVDFLSSLLDPQSRTLSVRGILPNPGLTLKPNMFARMAIEVGQIQTLAIPESALQGIGDTEMVYVRTSPTVFEERRVVTGRRIDQFVEIRGGLKEGEQIAVSGTVGLKGMVIKKLGDQATEAGKP